MVAFTGIRTPLKPGISAASALPNSSGLTLAARGRSPSWIVWPALATALATSIVLATGPALRKPGWHSSR
jgi:hypothetical protein